MIAEVLVSPQQLPLKHARAQVGLSQEALANAASMYAKVSVNVVRNCEQGIGRISLVKAYAILRVLNQERARMNMPELGLEDLSWKIRE